MKSTKKLIITVVFLTIAMYTQAQVKTHPYADTLVLRTDNQVDVKFLFYRMSDKEVHMKDDLWKSILNIMSTAVSSSTYDGGVTVTYSKIKQGEGEAAKVEVKEIENNSDIFLIESEGMREILADRIEFRIYLSKAAILFSVNSMDDLEAISELSVESVWDQVNLKYKNYGKRNIYSGTGKFKYGKANVANISGRPGGNDSIELSSGVGLGFYRDRFVPDLSFKLGFHLPDRFGNKKLEFGALYTQHYFISTQSEGDSEPDLNGFLSGFISHQFLPNYEIGIAFGALIHRDGDYFKGGTYKLSFYTSKDNSKVEFTPELIFTEDFKSAFPAIRFGLSF